MLGNARTEGMPCARHPAHLQGSTRINCIAQCHVARAVCTVRAQHLHRKPSRTSLWPIQYTVRSGQNPALVDNGGTASWQGSGQHRHPRELARLRPQSCETPEPVLSAGQRNNKPTWTLLPPMIRRSATPSVASPLSECLWGLKPAAAQLARRQQPSRQPRPRACWRVVAREILVQSAGPAGPQDRCCTRGKFGASANCPPFHLPSHL